MNRRKRWIISDNPIDESTSTSSGGGGMGCSGGMVQKHGPPCCGEEDNIYYNVIMNNTTSLPIQASFEENRTVSIVTRPSDYTLSIVRFFLPGAMIPIFSFPTGLGQSLWVVVRTNAGVDNPVQLTYSPEVIPPLVVNPPFPYSTYQHFLNDVNTAMLAAHNAAGGILPAPFFFYTPSTQLITLRIDGAQYKPQNPAGLELWFNFNLFNFFYALRGDLRGFNNVDHRDIMVFARNNLNNQLLPGTELDMTTELNTLYMWNDLVRLFITTGNVPVKNEYILAGEGSNATQAVLTDFEPQQTGDFRTADVFQYFPQGPYRKIDLLQDTPLSKFDCRVWWQNKNGEIFPLMIPPHRSATIKFLFEKKHWCC